MKTVTLVALNIKGYYSPAQYLLRDYALTSEEIRSHYTFKLIDHSISFNPQRRLYRITFLERLKDFALMLRAASRRNAVKWAKTQLKLSPLPLKVLTELAWWRAFLHVVATRPQIVGFSCYIWNVNGTVRMVRWIKRFFPGTTIVLGGQEVTNSGREFIKEFSGVDFVVDGEGEETFRELLVQLITRDKQDIRNVPGIVGRYDDAFERRKPMEHLEDIPSPWVSIRKDQKMLRKVDRARLGYMVETARGCPFRCSFCFESDKFKSVRHFSLDKVADEIFGMSYFGVRMFHILDPVLCNSDSKRLKALADIIRKANGFGNTDFSVEMYAELLKEDMLDDLDVFGSFDVGLQTCNPHVLKKINRYFDREKFCHGIDLLKERKKFFAVYLIYGLPGETLPSFIKSVQFVISLRPPNAFINHLCVLRGTPLRRDAEREGLKYNAFPPYLIRSTASMSEQDLVTCNNLCTSFVKEFKASMGGVKNA